MTSMKEEIILGRLTQSMQSKDAKKKLQQITKALTNWLDLSDSRVKGLTEAFNVWLSSDETDSQNCAVRDNLARTIFVMSSRLLLQEKNSANTHIISDLVSLLNQVRESATNKPELASLMDKLLAVAKTPWSHPVLKAVLIGQPLPLYEVLSYLCGEPLPLLWVRIELLMQGPHPEYALNLLHWLLLMPQLQNAIHLHVLQLKLLYAHNQKEFDKQCLKLSCCRSLQILKSVVDSQEVSAFSVCLARTFVLQVWFQLRDCCCVKDLVYSWLFLEQEASQTTGMAIDDALNTVIKLSHRASQLLVLIQAANSLKLELKDEMLARMLDKALQMGREALQQATSTDSPTDVDSATKMLLDLCTLAQDSYKEKGFPGVYKAALVASFSLRPDQEAMGALQEAYISLGCYSSPGLQTESSKKCRRTQFEDKSGQELSLLGSPSDQRVNRQHIEELVQTFSSITNPLLDPSLPWMSLKWRCLAQLKASRHRAAKSSTPRSECLPSPAKTPETPAVGGLKKSGSLSKSAKTVRWRDQCEDLTGAGTSSLESTCELQEWTEREVEDTKRRVILVENSDQNLQENHAEKISPDTDGLKSGETETCFSPVVGDSGTHDDDDDDDDDDYSFNVSGITPAEELSSSDSFNSCTNSSLLAGSAVRDNDLYAVVFGSYESLRDESIETNRARSDTELNASPPKDSVEGKVVEGVTSVCEGVTEIYRGLPAVAAQSSEKVVRDAEGIATETRAGKETVGKTEVFGSRQTNDGSRLDESAQVPASEQLTEATGTAVTETTAKRLANKTEASVNEHETAAVDSEMLAEKATETVTETPLEKLSDKTEASVNETEMTAVDPEMLAEKATKATETATGTVTETPKDNLECVTEGSLTETTTRNLQNRLKLNSDIEKSGISVVEGPANATGTPDSLSNERRADTTGDSSNEMPAQTVIEKSTDVVKTVAERPLEVAKTVVKKPPRADFTVEKLPGPDGVKTAAEKSFDTAEITAGKPHDGADTTAKKPPDGTETTAGKPPKLAERTAEKLLDGAQSTAEKPPDEAETHIQKTTENIDGKPTDVAETRSEKPLIGAETRAEKPPDGTDINWADIMAEKSFDRAETSAETLVEKPPDMAEMVAEKPPDGAETAAEKLSDVAETVAEKPLDEAETAAEKISDVAETASEKPHYVAETVAEKPLDAAETAAVKPLDEAQTAAEKRSDVAETASEKLHYGAETDLEKPPDEAETTAQGPPDGLEIAVIKPPDEVKTVAEKQLDWAETAAEKQSDKLIITAQKPPPRAAIATEKPPDWSESTAEKPLDRIRITAEKLSEGNETTPEKTPDRAALQTALTVVGEVPAQTVTPLEKPNNMTETVHKPQNREEISDQKLPDETETSGLEPASGDGAEVETEAVLPAEHNAAINLSVFKPEVVNQTDVTDDVDREKSASVPDVSGGYTGINITAICENPTGGASRAFKGQLPKEATFTGNNNLANQTEATVLMRQTFANDSLAVQKQAEVTETNKTETSTKVRIDKGGTSDLQRGLKAKHYSEAEENGLLTESCKERTPEAIGQMQVVASSESCNTKTLADVFGTLKGFAETVDSLDLELVKTRSSPVEFPDTGRSGITDSILARERGKQKVTCDGPSLVSSDPMNVDQQKADLNSEVGQLFDCGPETSGSVQTKTLTIPANKEVERVSRKSDSPDSLGSLMVENLLFDPLLANLPYTPEFSEQGATRIDFQDSQITVQLLDEVLNALTAAGKDPTCGGGDLAKPQLLPETVSHSTDSLKVECVPYKDMAAAQAAEKPEPGESQEYIIEDICEFVDVETEASSGDVIAGRETLESSEELQELSEEEEEEEEEPEDLGFDAAEPIEEEPAEENEEDEPESDSDEEPDSDSDEVAPRKNAKKGFLCTKCKQVFNSWKEHTDHAETCPNISDSDSSEFLLENQLANGESDKEDQTQNDGLRNSSAVKPGLPKSVSPLKESLRRKRIVKMPDSNFGCSLCDYTASRCKQLQEHFQTQHSEARQSIALLGAVDQVWETIRPIKKTPNRTPGMTRRRRVRLRSWREKVSMGIPYGLMGKCWVCQRTLQWGSVRRHLRQLHDESDSLLEFRDAFIESSCETEASLKKIVADLTHKIAAAAAARKSRKSTAKVQENAKKCAAEQQPLQKPDNQVVTAAMKNLTPSSKHDTSKIKSVTPKIKSGTPRTRGATPKIKNETKTRNETPRTKNESSKTDNETPKTKNESSKTDYETPKTQNESSKTDNETPKTKKKTPKTKNESSKTDKETLKIQNETPKTKKETPKTKNESPKVDSETQKSKNESFKTDNETPKTKNESSKTDYETPKTQNESSKTDNEAPKTKKKTPKTKNESSKTDKETLKIQNETPKTKKETPKTKNESPKVDSETQKSKNESFKTDNETPKTENELTKTKNETPKTKNEIPKTKNETPKTKSESSQPKNETQKTNNETPKTKNELTKTKNETPKTKNEKPKTKNKTPKTKKEPSKTKKEMPKTKNESPKTNIKTPKTKNETTMTDNETLKNMNESLTKNQTPNIENETQILDRDIAASKTSGDACPIADCPKIHLPKGVDQCWVCATVFLGGKKSVKRHLMTIHKIDCSQFCSYSSTPHKAVTPSKDGTLKQNTNLKKASQFSEMKKTPLAKKTTGFKNSADEPGKWSTKRKKGQGPATVDKQGDIGNNNNKRVKSQAKFSSSFEHSFQRTDGSESTDDDSEQALLESSLLSGENIPSDISGVECMDSTIDDAVQDLDQTLFPVSPSRTGPRKLPWRKVQAGAVHVPQTAGRPTSQMCDWPRSQQRFDLQGSGQGQGHGAQQRVVKVTATMSSLNRQTMQHAVNNANVQPATRSPRFQFHTATTSSQQNNSLTPSPATKPSSSSGNVSQKRTNDYCPSLYWCGACCRSVHHSELTVHLHTHRYMSKIPSKNLTFCIYCREIFPSETRLRLHQARQHPHHRGQTELLFTPLCRPANVSAAETSTVADPESNNSTSSSSPHADKMPKLESSVAELASALSAAFEQSFEGNGKLEHNLAGPALGSPSKDHQREGWKVQLVPPPTNDPPKTGTTRAASKASKAVKESSNAEQENDVKELPSTIANSPSVCSSGYFGSEATPSPQHISTPEYLTAVSGMASNPRGTSSNPPGTSSNPPGTSSNLLQTSSNFPQTSSSCPQTSSNPPCSLSYSPRILSHPPRNLCTPATSSTCPPGTSTCPPGTSSCPPGTTSYQTGTSSYQPRILSNPPKTSSYPRRPTFYPAGRSSCCAHIAIPHHQPCCQIVGRSEEQAASCQAENKKAEKDKESGFRIIVPQKHSTEAAPRKVILNVKLVPREPISETKDDTRKRVYVGGTNKQTSLVVQEKSSDPEDNEIHTPKKKPKVLVLSVKTSETPSTLCETDARCIPNKVFTPSTRRNRLGANAGSASMSDNVGKTEVNSPQNVTVIRVPAPKARPDQELLRVKQPPSRSPRQKRELLLCTGSRTKRARLGLNRESPDDDNTVGTSSGTELEDCCSFAKTRSKTSKIALAKAGRVKPRRALGNKATCSTSIQLKQQFRKEKMDTVSNEDEEICDANKSELLNHFKSPDSEVEEVSLLGEFLESVEDGNEMVTSFCSPNSEVEKVALLDQSLKEKLQQVRLRRQNKDNFITIDAEEDLTSQPDSQEDSDEGSERSTVDELLQGGTESPILGSELSWLDDRGSTRTDVSSESVQWFPMPESQAVRTTPEKPRDSPKIKSPNREEGVGDSLSEAGMGTDVSSSGKKIFIAVPRVMSEQWQAASKQTYANVDAEAGKPASSDPLPSTDPAQPKLHSNPSAMVQKLSASTSRTSYKLGIKQRKNAQRSMPDCSSQNCCCKVTTTCSVMMQSRRKTRLKSKLADKSSLRRNREMLENSFASSQKLQDSTGETDVSHCKGQDLANASLPRKKPRGHWKQTRGKAVNISTTLNKSARSVQRQFCKKSMVVCKTACVKTDTVSQETSTVEKSRTQSNKVEVSKRVRSKESSTSAKMQKPTVLKK